MTQPDQKHPGLRGAGDAHRAATAPSRSTRYRDWIGKLQRVLPRVKVHIANQRAELLSVFQMLHHRYVCQGYIEPQPSGILYRPVFGYPTSRTLVAIDQPTGELMGTLSIISDEASEMPFRSVYTDRLAAWKKSGRRVAEISSLVIRSSSRQQAALTLFRLTQFAVQYLLYRHYDDMIFLVHPRHKPYYERCFEVEAIRDCRPHPLMRGSPACACRVNLHGQQRLNMHSLYLGEKIPMRQLAQPPITAADHLWFCHQAGVADPGPTTSANRVA
ncbi:MAG: hypothetical protein GTO03_05970 [Planctomycetales bacterium]|nr:hypothetical protein [Planctomycetales bacterium]